MSFNYSVIATKFMNLPLLSKLYQSCMTYLAWTYTPADTLEPNPLDLSMHKARS